MAKEFLFLCGVIRALQSKLLTISQLDRMIGAKSPAEAFRVLVELQYAKYFDESTKPEDFHRVIRQGILETKQLIQDGTDNDPAFEFVWRELDLNSLKRALKIRLVEGGTEIGDFTEENGFSDYGELTKSDLEAIVFRGENFEKLPPEYVSVVQDTPALFEKNNAFQDIEFALDRAHFDFLDRVAKKRGHPFLRSMLEFQADATNVRALARAVLIHEMRLPENGFVPHGTFKFAAVEKIENQEQLLKFLSSTRFASMISKIKPDADAEMVLLQIGRGIDKEFETFLKDAESGEIGSIQIPIVYLERRLQNARRLKFIMFSKFYGLAPEKIYETLPNL
jgi:vacuolar-type H+-ATPase subunit C/Vma6